MAGPGEVQDPRIRALLLGGGTAVGAAPFVVSAIKGSIDKKARARELGDRQAARKAKLEARFGQATPAAGRGILSTLGRFAGPAGAAAGMLMPSGNMAGPEATMLRPN